MTEPTAPRVEADLTRGTSEIEKARKAGYAWDDLPLLPHHAGYLRQRNVAAFVAGTRGYVSVGKGTQYAEVLPDTATGWSPEQHALILGQAETPTEEPKKPGRPTKAAAAMKAAREKNLHSLLLPMYSGIVGDESPAIWQARPDHPRRDADGDRVLKFEQPAGAQRGSELGEIPVDVHPRIQELVWEVEDGDGWTGTCPILLGEGVLKADAVHSAVIREGLEIAPVSVPGVTMTYLAPASVHNPHSLNRGDDPILTDAMLDLPWDGRTVYLCWDADWKFNPGVHRPLLITARLLEDEGAEVYILSVPVLNGDHKAGVDDYLADARKRGVETPLTDLLNAAISVDEAEFLTRPYTPDEIGRSDRLAAHADRYAQGIFSLTHKSWLRYDDERGLWTRDTSGNAIQEVAKKLTEFDLYSGDDGTRSRSSVANTVELARSHPLLQVTAADLNCDTVHLLNVSNGIVDLRTGELLPHDPHRRFTQVAPADYDPEALRRRAAGESWTEIAPTLMQTLDFLFYDDEQMIRTIQRSLGMTLLGEVAGGAGMSWWVSGGSSGKSTLTNLLLDILGINEDTGYATLLDHDSLTRESTPEKRAGLYGKRLLIFQEFPQGAKLNDGDLKKLTSDDVITGRQLYGNEFRFTPTHNAIAATNYLPKVTTTDLGTWRRLKRIDFPRTIAEGERDLTLPERLRAEYPQVLAWLVEGCIAYLSEGTYWAPSVVEATEAWRTNLDALSALISYVEIDPAADSARGAGVSDDTLYALYRDIVADDGAGYRYRTALMSALDVHQDFPPNAGRVVSGRRVRYKNLRLTAMGEERMKHLSY